MLSSWWPSTFRDGICYRREETVKLLTLMLSLTMAFVSEYARADIHLLCKFIDMAGFQSTVSIYKEQGRLVYQQDSVIMKNGVVDQSGGVAQITETPSQIRVEYTRNNMTTTKMIDRVTGKYLEVSKINGVPGSLEAKCSAAPARF